MAAPTKDPDKPTPRRRASAAQKRGVAKKAASTKKTAAKKTAPRKRAAAPESSVAMPTGSEPVATMAMDAAFAPAAPRGTGRRPLRNISEVRHFFRTNDVPIYFVGATPFNLLGLDRWVRNFSYITYYDAWDGAHPRVFTPRYKPYVEFESGEHINNWLLENPEVRAFISARAKPGVRPKIAMVFFDQETERICDELGYDLILPSAELRAHLDSKLVTTRLGNEVGVPSVPNVLATVEDFEGLMKAAKGAGLGNDLVVQTAYGDSGKTTFFIASESDWRKHRKDIVGHEVKVMKRINNRPVAVEAVLTSSGTIVGPFMSELTGHRKLTPYRGGWCGNEMFPEVLTGDLRSRAATLVRRLGDRLGQEGYRGFFEVDVLVDVDADEVYLGELNPRISGASSITNVTAGAYADVPLFLFHLLEFLDVDFDLDAEEINQRWQELAAVDLWSQMIIKETAPEVEQILTAAPTGAYTLDGNGTLIYQRAALDWHQLQNDNEAFFLRIYGAGDYRWKGADLGVLVTKGRLQTGKPGRPTRLTIRAKHLIDSVRAYYTGVPLAAPAEVAEAPLPEQTVEPVEEVAASVTERPGAVKGSAVAAS
ncbi:MAG: biotin carboxylase [Nocardioides sp.]|uniref:biotin carboxylase n=1 Tax=Nocardioides sp. TaxID=35761 RepID=UPI0039E6058C